ncbi:ABC transporter ATP-binding protein [Aerococcus sp. UMB1112A]|uniref:ABC transporter ATP-binding protein n=1 Tax=Aerococcus sp. UMB1112A TaxID=3050609 RepID=UPI002551B594|nr:ABC transporter ATP-binding protein [Aerococcus sp. UMB1112A]MDK8502423.1 ABC transporter ATP-binding protein [Aerococcus sp. UMB1112A]
MIKLTNIRKSYDDKVAVNGLNFTIPSNKLVVFLGKSGSGKSTTLRMINRLIDYDEGSITINGEDIQSFNVEDLRRKIGYMVQNVGLFPHMTVRENISAVPKLLNWDKDDTLERVKDLLHRVGLPPEEYINKYPSELSGGEGQRVGIARSLAANQEIILMDEPFGALDPITRSIIQNELIQLQQDLGKTIIFVTHDIDEALKLGDLIAVMKDGKLLAYDTPGRLIASEDPYIREFLGGDVYLKVLVNYQIADYMTPTTDQSIGGISIDATSSLRNALSLMVKEGVDQLQVIQPDRQTVGQISSGDILHVLRGERAHD